MKSIKISNEILNFISKKNFYFNRSSRSARPPSVIRVITTAGESLIQGVSVPPAMEKPRPTPGG